MKKIFSLFSFDVILWIVLFLTLVFSYFKIFPQFSGNFLIILAYLATLPVVYAAIKALKKRQITVDLMASIALIVSLMHKEWVSVMFISLMITSARIFADYTADRSRKAIESLMKLKPEKARIKKGNSVAEVPLSEIKKGDILVVGLGEGIPVDGAVVKGEAALDQSSLTGESVPIFKKEGDRVLSSTIVVSGNLEVRAEKVGKETTFEKIVELVESSQNKKTKINTIADIFAKWYIILTLIGSLALYIATKDLTVVLAVLLVSCADDVAVAVPLAFAAAITSAARRGIIIKGGDFIEALGKIKNIVVDKTGTLTKGKLNVVKFVSFDEKNKKEILKMAGAMGEFSKHPAALAIAKYTKENGVNFTEPQKYSEIGGKGFTAIFNKKIFISGKASFLEEEKVNISADQLHIIEEEKSKGFNVTLAGYDKKLAGFFALSDELRPKIKETVEQFQKLGVDHIVMLTGDNAKIARRIADETGIKEFHADLLPEDKISYLKKYLNNKNKTAMVGDGVNDAAALSLADVGIAMGAIGSDVAIESADIALMKDDFDDLPDLIKLGNKTMNIVRQDLIIWGTVNLAGLILVFTGVLSPSGAAAYNFVTDFFPLFNSFRLFR